MVIGDRDLQRFYMDGREIGTSFVKQSTGEFWNPDFAAMAESMVRARAHRLDHPSDLGSAFEQLHWRPAGRQ